MVERERKGEREEGRGGKMSGKEEGFTPYRSITFVTPLEKSLGENLLSLSLFSNIFLFPPSQILCLFTLFGTRCNLDGKRGRGSKFTGGRVSERERERERETKMLEREREERKKKEKREESMRSEHSFLLSLFFFWYFWHSTVVVHPRSKKEARSKRRMKEGHEKDRGGNG